MSAHTESIHDVTIQTEFTHDMAELRMCIKQAHALSVDVGGLDPYVSSPHILAEQICNLLLDAQAKANYILATYKMKISEGSDLCPKS